jgi:acylphosphatase
MKRVKITISGKVQKIGFRFSAMQEAVKVGVTGFALNRPDGTVYIEAEGCELKVKEFVDWCHNGPPWAEVSEVVVEEDRVKGDQSFEIRKL